MHYEAKTFDIPELDGIGKQTIEEHLKLYQGYVKHVNLIHEKMKNHEYYFAQFESGPKDIDPESELYKSCAHLWGSWEGFLEQFTATALTRGVGWAMLYLDRDAQRLVMTWVDEQHIGQLADVDIVLGLDMWEHSYMLDYPPSEKKKYIDAFFKNINWETIASRI